MNGVIIANEVKLYQWIAVSLRICNDCFIGPFAIIMNTPIVFRINYLSTVMEKNFLRLLQNM
jgi:hypothetical protein